MVESLWGPNPKASHEWYRKKITAEEVAKIEGSSNPISAAESVMRQPDGRACAIIDSMSPLGAAFVLLILKTVMKDNPKARQVLALAGLLQIRGTQGLTLARDEMLRATGIAIP